MGVLLRQAAQNFNPQIHTEENSLSVQMKKHFAVRKKSIDLFARYAKFQSFCFATDRNNKGAGSGAMTKAKSIYDNAYRISYEGALITPAYFYGAVQLGSVFAPGNPSPDMSGVAGVAYTNGKSDSTITTNTIGSVAIKHDPANNIFGDKFNPNDSFVLDQGLGLLCVILDFGRLSADGTHYVLDFKTVGPASVFAEAHFNEDEVLTEGGNYFGQGSLKGYQRSTKNRWRINYSSIHRYTMTMTGSALKQKVAPIYNDESGAKMWEFDEILKGERYLHMSSELALRYSRISMNPSTHAWYENSGTNQLTKNGFKLESGMTAPIIGDGWVPQIKDNAEFAYNPNTGTSHSYVEAMMMSLANRSPFGSEGNTFVFLTDKIGRMATDKGFKKLIGWGNSADTGTNAVTNMSVNISTGQENKLGFNINRYHYLGNDVVVIEDDLLNHPGNFNTNGGVTGSGHIFCLNASPINGVSNFEVYSRAGRDFLKKTIDGMHSFDPQSERGSKASSGFDGCRIDMLKEVMPIIYDDRSCGILKASAKYTGGALAGSDFITANSKATTYIF